MYRFMCSNQLPVRVEIQKSTLFVWVSMATVVLEVLPTMSNTILVSEKLSGDSVLMAVQYSDT